MEHENGCVSPLTYTLILSAELPKLGRESVGELEVELGFGNLLVLGLRFVSGWSVLFRGPWRTLTARIPR